MAKNFNLKRDMAKDVVYGALSELARNKQVWYNSSIDSKYSHLTDEGKEAIIHIVEDMFREIHRINYEEIKSAAKQQTIDAFKGKE